MRINDYNWTEIYLKAEVLLSEYGIKGGEVDPNAKLLLGGKAVCHVKIPERENKKAIKRLVTNDNVTCLYGYNVNGNRYKKVSIAFSLEEVSVSEVKDGYTKKDTESKTTRKTRELFELIRNNPDLPILPFVDSEIVADDDYMRWIGSWGSSHIIEYIMVEMYNDYPKMVERGETERYEEFLLDQGWSDEAVEEHIKNIEWIKAIAVNIDLPE